MSSAVPRSPGAGASTSTARIEAGETPVRAKTTPTVPRAALPMYRLTPLSR